MCAGLHALRGCSGALAKPAGFLLCRCVVGVFSVLGSWPKGDVPRAVEASQILTYMS